MLDFNSRHFLEATKMPCMVFEKSFPGQSQNGGEFFIFVFQKNVDSLAPKLLLSYFCPYW